MNTYEYIMERKRMCDSFDTKCKGCPANFDGMFCCGLAAMSTLDTKEQIAIVEKWSAEHPKKKKKTRQDIFLKQYPETRIGDNGCICLCPGDVFNVYRNTYGTCAKPNAFCPNCRREFWTQEVEGG